VDLLSSDPTGPTGNDTLRLSGKKISLGNRESLKSSKPVDWKFSRRPGGWQIAEASDGKRSRLMILPPTPTAQGGSPFSASLNGKLWSGEWIHSSGAGSSMAEATSDADLTAQFPGKVRKILVQNGSRVNEGDPLFLVEAMKMEFSVKAPFSGTVVKILVQEQQQLMPGDRFVDLEAEKK
jgi:biotin carboxyl carrier protein